MEAIGFVVAIVALGALAVRFGRDSREGFRSKEHELAAYGVTWCDLTQGPPATAAPSAVPAVGDEPPAERLVHKEPFPTLAFIERALGHAAPVLTTAPDASALEIRARELVANHWSDTVWTTGIVAEVAFRRVLAELAPDLLVASVDARPQPDVIASVNRVRAEAAVVDGPAERMERTAFTEIAAQYAAA